MQLGQDRSSALGAVGSGAAPALRAVLGPQGAVTWLLCHLQGKHSFSRWAWGAAPTADP